MVCGWWLSEFGEPKPEVISCQLSVFRESQANGEFSRVGSRKGISGPLSLRSSVVHSLPKFPVARCSVDVSPLRA